MGFLALERGQKYKEVENPGVVAGLGLGCRERKNWFLSLAGKGRLGVPLLS